MKDEKEVTFEMELEHYRMLVNEACKIVFSDDLGWRKSEDLKKLFKNQVYTTGDINAK
jgi:hypothetical protein